MNLERNLKQLGRPRKDLLGCIFGYLTVIDVAEDYIEPKAQCRRPRWKCQCKCGNVVFVTSSNLLRGHVKSCGCYRVEQVKKANSKCNRFNLSGEYGIGYTSKGEEFWFDLEDYDKIKDYYWQKYNNGYFVANFPNTRKTLQLHRLIMGIAKEDYHKIVVDHKHGSSTLHDNRKSNLRIVTRRENILNSRPKQNKSGYTGIYYKSKTDSYEVYINDTLNHRKYLGKRKTLDEAIKLRQQAEDVYYKDLAYRNSRKGTQGLC